MMRWMVVVSISTARTTRMALLYLRGWDVVMAAVILFLVSCAVQRRRVAGGKGPMLWPVVGILPVIFLNLGNIYDWTTDALCRCGGTFPYRGVWFGGAHGVVTSDPANVEYMLKTRFANFPKGRYYRERFADFLGDGIFNADNDTWKHQRRAATSEMHSARFVAYSAQTISDLVHQKLLKLLHKLSTTNQTVDLQDVFLRFTFDNICTAAFGIHTGCLTLDLPHVSFAKAFEEATELTLFRFIVPPFVWKLMRFLDVGSEKKLKVAIREINKFAEKTVRDRKHQLVIELGERFDLLSRLMEAKNEDGKFRFSEKFMKDFCISFILAGRDTSSVALTWFFWLLQRHPAVEEKILEEIHRIVDDRCSCQKDDNVDDGELDDIVFSVDELKRMEYLQAALSESLRLYPSVPLDFKEVVEDDILPDGSVVRKGGRVLYSIYSMARMESIWGKDCREFRPERWLKDGMFVSESQFKYPVFNAGPRLCVGKKFAYTQMKMLAAAVILRYSVHVLEGQDITPKMTTTLYMRNGIRVKFNPRFTA